MEPQSKWDDQGFCKDSTKNVNKGINCVTSFIHGLSLCVELKK